MLFMTIMPMLTITILGFALAGLGLYLASQYFPPQTEEETATQEAAKEDTVFQANDEVQ